MCLSDFFQSTNLNTYVPGSSTLFGIWIGSLMVIVVFLSDWSARAGDSPTADTSTRQENKTGVLVRLFICIPPLTPIRFLTYRRLGFRVSHEYSRSTLRARAGNACDFKVFANGAAGMHEILTLK